MASKNDFKDAVKGKLFKEIWERENEIAQKTSAMIKESQETSNMLTSGDSSGGHPADASFAPDCGANHLNKMRAEVILLREAIERVDAGTYGICFECEEPIVLKRMDIVPWATQCTPCLKAKEALQKRAKRKSYDSTRIKVHLRRI